jgi:hypothetical protein
MRAALELLEDGPSDDLLLALAWLAGREVELDQDELKGALRRSELLLAAGGDRTASSSSTDAPSRRSQPTSTARTCATGSRTRSPGSPPPRRGWRR